MKRLSKRQALATLIPELLITSTLVPLFWSNIEVGWRVPVSRPRRSWSAEYDVLLQDVKRA
jgi:hypothetical protein